MSNYFRKIPDFDYVSRLPNAKISDYIRVKNFFRKAKLREDILDNLAFFTRYTIEGDDRPDNVAFKVYNDASLDWVVLSSNNIVNIQSEWPLSQSNFDTYLLGKYGDYDTLYNGIHHYETAEVRSNDNIVVVPAGLNVDSSFSVSYYDFILEQQIDSGNIAIPITNYQYEEKLNNSKRFIYVLKQYYLNIVVNDLDNILKYKEGSSQYVSEDLVKGNNIRLYS